MRGKFVTDRSKTFEKQQKLQLLLLTQYKTTTDTNFEKIDEEENL